jgi:hypothetical protein
MATRENQGLQIALIIFLMITVGLAISTYYFFRQAEDQRKLAEAETARATAAETLAKSRHYQVQAIKFMVGDPNVTEGGLAALKAGLPPDEGIKDIDRIRADFDKDMAMFDDTIPKENRNWRTLPQYLYSNLMKRNVDLIATTTSEKQIIKSKDDLQAAADGKIKAAEDGLQVATTDNQAQVAKFSTEIKNANDAKTTLAAQIDKFGKDLAAQQAEAIKEKQDTAKTIAELKQEATTKAAKIAELTSESFERPHGQVTFVNIRNNSCYINLGRADGLQRQITFSVYDPDVTTVNLPTAGDEREESREQQTKRKASIEVIDIIDDHLAECRILEDNVKNPILPGDNVFTPAWRPGQKLQFALVGRMDIDDDLQDDREKIKNLIEANGGRIVCEVLNDGTRVGNISVNTRFLVIGDRPEESAGEKMRAEYNNIIGAAERNGVQQITVRDLLVLMGYKGTDRTVTLGNSGAADVPPPKPAGAPAFRPRPAPAAAGGDAFR